MTTVPVSSTSEAAREAARDTDGKFGAQHRAEGGGTDVLTADPAGSTYADMGFDSDDATEWERANFAPVEAANWANAGLTSDDAVGWRGAGFEPNHVQAWIEQGISSSLEAIRWEDAGMSSPYSAGIWRSNRFTPRDAKEWDEAGFGPSGAATWRRDDFASSEAAPWRDAGFDSKRALEMREADFEPGHATDYDGLTVADAVTLRDRGMSGTEYREDGWAELQVGAKTAVTFWKAGMTPGDVTSWSAVADDAGEAIKWFRSVGSPNEAVSQWHNGLGPEDAAPWSDAGIGPEDAPHFAGLGLTPSEAAEVQRMRRDGELAA